MTGPDDGIDTALRDRLIVATLAHTPFDGWSPAALRAGARDIDVSDDVAQAAFPHGTSDMIRHFSRWADRCMIAGLEAADLDEMRIHERVTIAVELRLEALEPHREAVRRGLSWLAMPQNALLGARLHTAPSMISGMPWATDLPIFRSIPSAVCSRVWWDRPLCSGWMTAARAGRRHPIFSTGELRMSCGYRRSGAARKTSGRKPPTRCVSCEMSRESATAARR
jgi:hypothetical protein